jgi:AraC-like DNA-binding protein
MDSFQIVQPSALLAPYVKHYWFMTVKTEVRASERVIPTGMMCLMFHRGERLFSTLENEWQPRAFLSGQGVSCTDLSYHGLIDMIAVNFRPAGAKAFFKMPLIELNEQTVDVNTIGDPQLMELEKRLSDTPDRKSCVLMIEDFLYKRIYQLETYNLKRIDATLQSIFAGEQNIDRLAATACLGYKQFKRVFAEYVGANPKDYLRVVRFQKALHTLQVQPDIRHVHLAYDCGYYDQSHLIKEFRQFSGYTPTEYLAVCEPYSDLFS